MLMKKTLLAVLALVLPLLAQSSFADDPWQHRDEHHWEEPHRDAPWGQGRIIARTITQAGMATSAAFTSAT